MNHGPRLAGRDHLRHLVRAVVWQPVLLGGGVAVVLAYDGFRTATEQTLAAASVALGCAFVLDDPAWATVASSPASLWRRRIIRMATALPVAGLLWLVSMLVAGPPRAQWWPAGLEVTAMIGVSLAVAALAALRSRDGIGGAAAGPVLLALIVFSAVLPRRWAVYPVVAHQWRWVLVLGLALVALRVASRDPASRPFSFHIGLRPRTIGEHTQ